MILLLVLTPWERRWLLHLLRAKSHQPWASHRTCTIQDGATFFGSMGNSSWSLVRFRREKAHIGYGRRATWSFHSLLGLKRLSLHCIGTEIKPGTPWFPLLKCCPFRGEWPGLFVIIEGHDYPHVFWHWSTWGSLVVLCLY